MRRDGDRSIDVWDAAAWRARTPVLVAHRGGVIGPGAPENSLAAIQRAADQGFDMVEVDVRASADGEPVLFHGDWSGSLRVSCGVDRTVHELTLAELRATRYRATDQHVAGLDEALALCAELGLGVMLELKADPAPPALLDRVAALLDRHGMARSAVTISSAPALTGRALLRLSIEEASCAPVLPPNALAGRFWFGLPEDLPDELVLSLQRAAAPVLPALNKFRYPPHAHRELAAADAARLLAAGVDGFQIDGEYRNLFDV